MRAVNKGRWLFITVFVFSVVTIFSLVFLDGNDEVESQFHIGVLLTGDSRIEKLDGLKEGLEDLGYEKEALQFSVYNGKDQLHVLPSFAEQAIEDDPDIIVTMGAVETLIIKEHLDLLGEEIPVVFAGIAAPLELGIIEDYRHPGGMFTGVDNYHLNLSAKRLEMLTKLVPDMERTLVLYDGSVDVSVMSLGIVKDVAEQLGTEIKAFDTFDKRMFEEMEESLQQTDGILVLPSYNIESLAGEITDFTLKHNVPSMGIFEKDVEVGFLASYGSPFFYQGYQSARHVSLILQGNHPSVIPVELPDTIKFLINDSVRAKLGVELDENMRLMADFLFQVEAAEGGRNQ